MTPKEKAKELFNKCSSLKSDYEQIMTYSMCKECALIAVDEIIEIVYNSLTSIQELNYWLEVKDEIEQL